MLHSPASNAPESAKPEERLFPMWKLAGLVFIVVLMFGSLYSTQPLFEHMVNLEHPNQLSLFLLNILQQENPQSDSWQLILAKQQLDHGDVNLAYQTLQPLMESHNHELRDQALFLDLQLMEMRMFAGGQASQDTQALKMAIAARVSELLHTTPSQEMLESLGDSALLVGDWELASGIYELLAESHPRNQATWYRKAAKLALGKGGYSEAAMLFFLARSGSEGLQQRRDDYLSALKALVAGNQLQNALVQAEMHLEDLAHDDMTLKFLVKLGRAAGNGTFAQKYVGKLLQVSWTRFGKTFVLSTSHHRFPFMGESREPREPSVPHEWESAQRPVGGNRFFVKRISDETAKYRLEFPERLRPYDPEAYELAYTVYVENQQLEWAYQVASKAVASVPNDLTWRRRLAQIAEWTNRQEQALRQWQVVVKEEPNADVWANVVRLAHGLHDNQTWMEGLRELEQGFGLTLTQVKDLADAYEGIGQPEQAITQLRNALKKYPNHREVFEWLGFLYERMGNIKDAAQVFHAVEERFGGTVMLASKQAELLYLQGKVYEALAVLEDMQHEASLDETSYWARFGGLAWDLQEDELARQAYGRLLKQKTIKAFQLERYVLLIKEDSPEYAVQLARQGWKQLSKSGLFFLTLNILLEKNDWNTIDHMLEELTPAQQRILEPYQQYWAVRTEALSRKGNIDDALQWYRVALLRNPDSVSTRLSMLWMLIDHRRLEELKPLLRKWKKIAYHNPRFWDSFASAYVLLGQPVKALPFFERKFRQDRRNYLWVLYYADALAEAGDLARAWKLREYAWQTLRSQANQNNGQKWERDDLIAYARLALTRETGDHLSSIFRRLLRRGEDRAIRELLLSWYLSRNEYPAARVMLWRFNAGPLPHAVFAKLTLAVADNDWVAIERLLNATDPPLDRLQVVEGSKHLQRNRLVQTLAFEGMEDSINPDPYVRAFADATLSHIGSPLDTVQRLPLSGQLWSHIPNVGTRFVYQNRAPLLFQEIGQLWAIPLSRGIEIFPFVTRRWQDTSGNDVLQQVPTTDTRLGAHMQWGTSAVLGEFSLYHRKALSSFMAFRGRTKVAWDRRSTTEFLVGRNLEADTSVGMLVGGVKDLLRMGHTYHPSKWDSTFFQVDYPRFYSQDRKFIGQGMAIEGAWSHHFRLAYPDMAIRLSGSLQRYSRRQNLSGKLPTIFPLNPSTIPVSNVLPKEFRQIELGGGLGESVFFSYGQVLRPFIFGGVNLNPETGVGANVSGGLVGQVFGPDRLSLHGRYVRGGFGQDSTVVEGGLHYQWWF